MQYIQCEAAANRVVRFVYSRSVSTSNKTTTTETFECLGSAFNVYLGFVCVGRLAAICSSECLSALNMPHVEWAQKHSENIDAVFFCSANAIKFLSHESDNLRPQRICCSCSYIRRNIKEGRNIFANYHDSIISCKKPLQKLFYFRTVEQLPTVSLTSLPTFRFRWVVYCSSTVATFLALIYSTCAAKKPVYK